MVDDHDPGFYFVGKIFDRPLRSRQEEMEFCYGDVEAGDSNGEESSRRKSGAGNAKNNKGQRKTVKFDWIPPNVSKTLVSEFTRHLENVAKFSCRCVEVPFQDSSLRGFLGGSNWHGFFFKQDNPYSKLGLSDEAGATSSSNRAESRTRASPNLPNFVDKHGMHAVATNGRILLEMRF